MPAAPDVSSEPLRHDTIEVPWTRRTKNQIYHRRSDPMSSGLPFLEALIGSDLNFANDLDGLASHQITPR